MCIIQLPNGEIYYPPASSTDSLTETEPSAMTIEQENPVLAFSLGDASTLSGIPATSEIAGGYIRRKLLLLI